MMENRNNKEKAHFQINKYLSVKLINNKTQIFVNNKPFRHCKYLFLVNPHNNPQEPSINSIDEAAEILNKDLHTKLTPKDLNISPEDMFWGHCSNLQAWAENDYDTRLLHRNLAFPLLKKLSETGDPQAKKRFKEEIAKRFIEGNQTVINYLREQKYLTYLNLEELNVILDRFKNHSKISLLDLSGTDLEYLPLSIERFTNIREIKLSANKLSTLPKGFANLNRLERIDLSNNRFTIIPSSINELTSLKQLNLSSNQIRNVPKWINGSKEVHQFYFSEKIDSLEILNLNENLLNQIPDSIGNLVALKKLELGHNSLFKIPSSIGNLKRLEFFSAEHNQLNSIPKSIGNLHSLKELNLDSNRLISLPNSIQNLKNLEILSIENNNLKNLPSSIGNLEKLRKVNLLGNPLKSLPESFFNLKSLDFISLDFGKVAQFPEESKRGLKRAIKRGVRIHDLSYTLMPYKIIIIGDKFVGKTSLLKRMCGESFPYTYTLTVGVQVSIYELKVGNTYIPINIWDIGGDPRFRFIIDTFFKHSLGALIVYDLSKPLTEGYIKDWRFRCKHQDSSMPIILVGNKKDLANKDQLKYLDSLNIKNEFGFLDHVFVSAKQNNPLEALIRKLVKQHTLNYNDIAG